MSDLSIVLRDVDDLVPYANNAKKHESEQIDQIAASIKEFGFNNPILLDGENGVIAGHGRLLAAKKLKLIQVPTIELSHLTGAQKKAYILADNRLAEVNTSWDFDLLSLELESIQVDMDIELTGFDDSFILKEPDEGLTDEDETPELPEEPVTVLGDIWVMGEHRLMCGDSLSTVDMDLLMEGRVADMVFTDPPYGVSYQSNMRTKSEKFDVLENDDTLLDIAPTLEIYSTGWMFVWTTWKVLNKWIGQMGAFGYPSNMVVWSKGGGGIGDLKKTFSTDYEMALVFNRGAELCGKRIGSVWSIGKDKAIDYKHPTQKPVSLAEEAIDKTTRNGQMVLDIFGGSGSTLIACAKSGRICRSMELSPNYCDVIVERWQNYTGQKATLESNGQTFDEMKTERTNASG